MKLILLVVTLNLIESKFLPTFLSSVSVNSRCFAFKGQGSSKGNSKAIEDQLWNDDIEL